VPRRGTKQKHSLNQQRRNCENQKKSIQQGKSKSKNDHKLINLPNMPNKRCATCMMLNIIFFPLLSFEVEITKLVKECY